MLLRGRNKKKKKEEEEAKQKAAVTAEASATKIQSLVRRFLARRRIKRIAKENYVRVFDPTFKRYFWYSRIHEKSLWAKPRSVELFSAQDIAAVFVMQRYIRGFIHRCRARKLANEKYSRYYDMNTNQFYWVDNETQHTTYQASKWLQRQNIQMPVEDKLLLESQLKIRELERKLAEKEAEIKQIRKKRYEDLEPEVIKDKVKEARNLQRSRNMDDWSTDDLSAWFMELKMEEYIPTLFSNRVNGLLFVNLSDEEIIDLGITNKFHLRKLQLIMKSYRIRFQQRKERRAAMAGRGIGAQAQAAENEEDDELLSEYSPSELSAIIAAEEADNDQLSEREGSEDDDSIASAEDEVEKITEEQRLQKRMDETNITIERIMAGDNANYPIIGDVVRVKYTCTLLGSTNTIMSTKHVLDRPWVEFVLGIGQVVKGFDRAMPHISVGERARITLSPEYGYGAEGLPPHIPPNTGLVFDVTLLGYRPRAMWVKPLLQDANTLEKPHHKDLEESLKLAKRSGMADARTSIFSTSMVLREEEEQMLAASRPGRAAVV